MADRESFPRRLLKAIVYSRFEPVETIMAIYISLLGLWTATREISTDTTTTFFGSGRVLIATGIIFGIIGIFHLYAVYKSYGYHNGWVKARETSLLVITMGFFFVMMEVVLGLGIGSTRWAPWAALTLISAATYLALVLKR